MESVVITAVPDLGRPERLARHRAAVRARLSAAGIPRASAGSISWTINRELIVVAGWGRAILLQLAHPLVGAGVADHSSFRGSLTSGVRRLTSTVRAMLAMTFGTEDQAVDAAAIINSIHDHVFGRLDERGGTTPVGTPYSAHDPELLRWVHVTLIDSILLTYERVVGPLTAAERDRYCAEAAVMEPLVGIPEGLLPRTSEQLAACTRTALDAGHLGTTTRTRALGHALLFPSGWRVLWPAFRPFQLLTVGSLPPDIRDAYGFTWTPRDERALARWTHALRLIVRATPRVLRHWPASR